MRIKVSRQVPGFVNFRVLVAGCEYDLDDVTAVSLINDGYAEPAERAEPSAARETAVKRPPGRPRKTE